MRLPTGAAATRRSWDPRTLAGGGTQARPSRAFKALPGLVLLRNTNGNYRPGSPRLPAPAKPSCTPSSHPSMFTFTDVRVNTSWVLLSTDRQPGVTHATPGWRSRVVSQWLCVSTNPIKVLEFSRKTGTPFSMDLITYPKSVTNPTNTLCDHEQTVSSSEPVFPHRWDGYLEIELQEIKCLDQIKRLCKCLFSP